MLTDLTSDIPLVASPEEVTPKWLTSVLRGNDVDADVSSFEYERIGTGQVGMNIRFTLQYSSAGDDAPPTIVGKYPSPDPVSRETGTNTLTYLRESMFYQQVKPQVDIQTPVPLYNAFNPENHDFVLMMHDLAPAEQGDQLSGCSPEQAELAIRQIAKLHGPRWGDESLDELDWLNGSSQSEPTDPAMVALLWEGFKDRYADRISSDAREAGEVLVANYAQYTAPFEGPRTIAHGDYRLDNMLFGSEAGGFPLAVVDWQTPAYGAGAGDVAYFIGTSVPRAVRPKHEQALLDAYFEELSKYDIGSYSKEYLFNDYRRYALNGYAMAIFASMVVQQTPRGDDMFFAMADRSVDLAMAHDSISLLMA